MLNVYLDIESIPQQPEDEVKKRIADTIQPPAQMSKPETIKEWMEGTGKYVGARAEAIEEQYHRTGLDGGRGQIVSISMTFADSPEIYCFYQSRQLFTDMVEEKVPRPDFPVSMYQTEQGMLAGFFFMLREELRHNEPFYIGHNIGRFDLRYLYHRCVVNQVHPGVPFYQDERAGRHYFDTMEAWAGFNGYISQDVLAEILGIEAKATELTGDKVWEYYKAGRHMEIMMKNRLDVSQNRQIHKRLIFK